MSRAKNLTLFRSGHIHFWQHFVQLLYRFFSFLLLNWLQSRFRQGYVVSNLLVTSLNKALHSRVQVLKIKVVLSNIVRTSLFLRVQVVNDFKSFVVLDNSAILGI